MPHHHCCILGCRSDSRYSKRDDTVPNLNEALRFFCVPSLTSKRALHNEWLKMIGRPELIVSRNTRVCSLHFVDAKPSKENPLPTLHLQSLNLPSRRRVRNPKCVKVETTTNVDMKCKNTKKTGTKAAKRNHLLTAKGAVKLVACNGVESSLIEESLENFSDSFNNVDSHDKIRKSKSNTSISFKQLQGEEALNCLNNRHVDENSALKFKIYSSPSFTPLNQSLLYSSMKTGVINEVNQSSLYYSHMDGSQYELSQDSKKGYRYDAPGTSDEGSCSNSYIVAPETIIHEFKQTQTDEKLPFKVSSETQTEILTPMTRVPLILWEGANEKNYQFQCQQLRDKVTHLKQQIRKRPTNIYVNLGIDFVKKDTNMMQYYTGFSCYTEFKVFLEELKPKLFPENFIVNCFNTLENELLLVLCFKRLELKPQDLAFRCGMSLCKVEKLINNWSLILDHHSSKPWLNH